ncbi:MAG TPA: tripartite tricarboxylate transporter substrate-binding protein [Alphaproteobacteria bacterium]|jgi:tripartite-type tricarboxylate transporter receptor subunit TctC|nr:tripartite tricarboxylate transporter substrate-binding protein [Alphaproteobacteria bacterium]
MRALLAASVLSLVAASAHAETAGEFFRGKTLTMVISTGVGGGYDLGGRLVARHLSKHLPGNPNVVPKNMPGAGHVRAANYMAVQAPRDGTTIATIGNAIALLQVMDGSGVYYDISKFNWIGTSDTSSATLYVWAATGVTSLEQAKSREVVIGATGAGGGNTQYPALLNNVLGTKFKVIAGYGTGSDINLAMERGEVDGRANHSFNSLLVSYPQWVSEKKINILLQIGIKPQDGFESVPMLETFARNDNERAIFKLFSAPIALGRPVAASPEVPIDRVTVLRRAFDATMIDPEFLADAQRSKLDISAIQGEALQKIAEDVVATPAAIIAEAKAAIEARDIVKGTVKSDKKSESE